MRKHIQSRQSGFTLVEILVVIAIIGILAGVTLVALRSARNFTGAAVVRHRLDDLEQCLEIYKQKFGEYPPDCTASKAEIRRHILKRWPNALKGGHVDVMVDIAYDQTYRGPGWSLLFWLAGMDGEGFLADDKSPIAAAPAASEPREEPVMELVYDSEGTGGGNWNERCGVMVNNIPIAYFRGTGDGYEGKELAVFSEFGVAAPYMKNGAWYKPDSFQLIYAGEDGDFGNCPGESDEDHAGHESGEHEGHSHMSRDLSDSSTISLQDYDNITNFTSGATLESEME